MKEKSISAFTTTALAIIAAFIFASGFVFFSHIFGSQNSVFLDNGIGAFAGAFFAFLFLRIGNFFEAIYQRQLKHYNCLVTLDANLNDLIAALDENTETLKKFHEIVSGGNIWWGGYTELPLHQTYLVELANVSLINNLYSYYLGVRRINQDLPSLLNGYKEIKDLFIATKINHEGYKQKTIQIVNFSSDLRAFCLEKIEEAIELDAKVKIYLRTDVPLGTKLARFFIPTKAKPLNQEEVEEEKQKIRKEIEDNINKSEERIAKILKKDT